MQRVRVLEMNQIFNDVYGHPQLLVPLSYVGALKVQQS